VSKTSQCIVRFTFKTASASFGFSGTLTVSILRQLKKVREKIYKDIFDGSELLFEDFFYVHVCILSQV